MDPPLLPIIVGPSRPRILIVVLGEEVVAVVREEVDCKVTMDLD